jgi:uncharacterized membrane protein YgcG
MQIKGRSSRFTSLRAPTVLVVLIAALFAASPVAAVTPATGVLRTGLPNHTLTPGVTNPAVTQATIHRTICVSGWTATIRPPSSYTTALKIRQLATYGFGDRRLADYEEDHLISLELGGSPTSSRNLWPEPHHISVGGVDLGSYAKDGFENHLRSLVCTGRLSLASAQHEIAGNWVTYWRSWKGTSGGSASGGGGSGGSAAPPSGSFYTPPGWDGHSDVDCPDFQTHAQAQSFFVGTGGSRSNDPARLDADHDGLACESLP